VGTVEKRIMKIYFIAVFLAAISLPIFSSVSAEDLEEGFMGYEWGDDIWKYEELKQLYSKGGITFYSNPAESYVIEDVIIGDVIYGFYRDKFYAVYVNIDSLDKYDMIERYMKTKYGLPDNKTSAKDRVFTYKWKYKDVTIKLKTDQVKGNMKVAFYHGPTSTGLKKERIMLDIEGSDRFFPIDKNEDINMVPFLESWNQR